MVPIGTCIIRYLSILQKWWSIRGIFQRPRSWSVISATLSGKVEEIDRLVIIHPDPSDLSNVSLQIEVSCPLPIWIRMPCSSTARDCEIPRHVDGGLSPSKATEKKEFVKYHALRPRDRSKCGCVVIRQDCFASNDKLKLSRSQNPIPP